MKARVHITLITAASLLGAAAFFFPLASSTPKQNAPQTMNRQAAFTSVSELAAPLLHREFTSSCEQDKAGYYKETLNFAADARATFARHYFSDADCKERKAENRVQAGRYAVAEEEAGQLLLIVRNLQDEKTANVTPYFEALIKVDNEQLVMQSSPSTALHYRASTSAI